MNTETIENIVKEMQTFAVYEEMSLEEQFAIAEDVKREIEEHDIFLHEYLSFRFETLSQEERRKYLPTSEYAWRLPANINIVKFSDKYELNKKAKQFVSRDYICLEDASRDDFKKFICRQDKIIAKPLNEQCGNGIAVYNTADYKPEELYCELIKKGTPLVEEYVSQHPDMAALHPSSLNTLRVITCMDLSGKNLIKMVTLKVGRGAACCDNVSAGGICMPVDIHTGTIIDDGMDKTCHRYEKHPDTGILFKGFVIPEFDRLMKKVEEYARLFGEMHFVGWDVAIKENGDIELIEANPIPDLTWVQFFYGPFAEKFRKLYGSREYGK